MNLLDYLEIGSEWVDVNEPLEHLTITSIDPDTMYPIAIRWADGFTGRDDVESFLRDFRPLDLETLLKTLAKAVKKRYCK